jgi:hypothetical protein
MEGQVRRRRKSSRKPAKAQQRIKAKRGVVPKSARSRRLSVSKDTQVTRLAARELAEAREQQAATSEILRVIRSSPNNAQPVFDTIAANAVRLCGARMGAVHLFDGKSVDIVAFHNFPPEAVEVLRRMYPRPPQIDQASGRAILSRAVAQIEDMPADPEYTSEVTIAGRWRSILAVPMFRDGDPIGAIVITRSEAGRFAEGHIDLLKTFADQAAIAIDNVRLFQAEQQRTHELTAALEQQTATSEVLGDKVKAVSDAWRRTRTIRNGEVGFLNRPLVLAEEPDVRRFFTFDRDSKLVAFAFFDPIYEAGKLVGYCSHHNRHLPEAGHAINFAIKRVAHDGDHPASGGRMTQSSLRMPISSWCICWPHSPSMSASRSVRGRRMLSRRQTPLSY